MWQIISGYISQIITTIGFFLFGKIVTNKKVENQQKIIISIFIVSVINTIIYLKFNGTIKTISMAIINILFYKYTFKKSYQKSIFITFIYMLILLITEIIELVFITEILNVSKDFGYNTYGGTIISNIITFIIFILITCLLQKFLRKVFNIKFENNMKIVVFLISISICILMFFYSIIKNFTLSGDSLLYLIAIIILLIVLFSLIKQTIENNKLTRKYDKLLEFMTTYENEIEKQRVLRHETKNEFLTIKAKINDKQKNKEIITYIDEILKEKITVKQEEYAKFGYLPANGIKGLCYLKTQEAQDKGLSTNINISKRIKKSNIYNLNIKEQRNLGKILGVLLDNAIEASLSSKDKQFGIEVYLNLNKECQIIISNSYDGAIDLNKIGKEKISTKGKNRGHGLLLVKHIIENNNVFDVKNNITNELYIQTVTINKS